VPRKIFGPKRDEIIGGWRNLHSVEFHDAFSSLDIIIMIKSKSMGWARMEGQKNSYNVLFGIPEGKSHSEDLDGRIILKWVFET
jgi:hypothetical protein